MGLTKWLLSKGLFYVFIFGIFYLVGSMIGWVPKPLQDLVKWLGDNFLLISILLMFTMAFIVMMRLTAPKRSQQP